jgi:hypothetical protein
MSSQRDFTEIQRRLLVIFERGHRMDRDQLNRAIDGLTGQTIQMVRRRRQEMPPPVPPPVAAAPLHWDFNLRPQSPQSPPPRELTGPLTAPLRAETRRNPLEKTVTISRAAFNANCTDSCSICLETHKKGDSIQTECNHEFGKQCFNTWMTSRASNHKCPTCRKEMPKVTMFKTRVSRTLTGPASAPARRPIVVEDELPLMIF